MKQILAFLFITISLGLFAQKSIPKQNPPKLFNDLAGIVDKHDADLFEKKLVALDDSSSNQIAIITIPTLNGEVIEDLAVSTFRSWGIGNKKTNNGVLLLIAMQERKIRIEVGYGLEGAIPDIVAKDIIEKDLKPAFKQGNYVAGINKAIDDLSKAAAGEYKVKRNKSSGTNSGGGLLLFIIILVIILIIIGNRGNRGGGYANRSGFSNVAEGLFWMNMLSGGGGRSGGSDWGGGGGGFGGFGGGSSGGGGASGGW